MGLLTSICRPVLEAKRKYPAFGVQWVMVRSMEKTMKKQEKITKLFRPGEIWVVTGPNGSGKTRLAMGLVASFAVDENKGALYMPLEKDIKNCAAIMANVHSGIPLQSTWTPKAAKAAGERLTAAAKAISGAPVYLSDMEPGGLPELIKEVRKFARKGIKLAVIDNVISERFGATGKTGTTLCGELRELAKDIKAAVVMVTPRYNKETDGEADSVIDV